jgi:hypothetical protein
MGRVTPPPPKWTEKEICGPTLYLRMRVKPPGSTTAVTVVLRA